MGMNYPVNTMHQLEFMLEYHTMLNRDSKKALLDNWLGRGIITKLLYLEYLYEIR